MSEDNRPIVMELLYFYMLNFSIAHEFGHIAHGHLRESSCNNYIDEIFCLSEGEKTKNWSTQLKEYDADSLAVTIQAFLFIQQWEDDIYANLSRFDNMFIANYLCFRTFADKTGRSFHDYMEKDIDEYDHPHPGIRMYYAYILYSYWIGTWKGYTTDVISVLTSGSHAVVSYEKQVLEKNSITDCYYSVAYTEKGSQHVMNLNNGWEELIDYFNQYAYAEGDQLRSLSETIFLGDGNGGLLSHLQAEVENHLGSDSWREYMQQSDPEHFGEYIQTQQDTQEHVLPYLQQFCSLEERAPEAVVVTESHEAVATPIGEKAPVTKPPKAQTSKSDGRKSERQAPEAGEQKKSIHERLKENKERISRSQGKDSPQKGVELA